MAEIDYGVVVIVLRQEIQQILWIQNIVAIDLIGYAERIDAHFEIQNDVVATATGKDKDIVALTAGQHVIAAAAIDFVIAGPAEDHVVTTAARNMIVAAVAKATGGRLRS